MEYISHRTELGARIRELRKSQHISGRGFSVMIGISRTYLRKLEDGQASPTYDMLERLAAGFGITVPELVDIDGERTTLEFDGRR